MTNYEKIKAMSVEDLAIFLNCRISIDDDLNTLIDNKVMYQVDGVVEWLESEVVE